MSIKNKITQLINKIFLRTEKADADISMCEENNVDSPSKKSKPKITLLQKRLLWCLIGIALLTGGYFWWRMPARMRIIAMIPIEHDYYTKTEYTPLGLYRCNSLGSGIDASALTLYGWEGKECWSTQLPGNAYNMKLAFSPDGHIAVICIFEKKQIIVMSLRDGHELGKVKLLRKDNQFDARDLFDSLTVENSGRVWLYKLRNPTCVIWAIDGKHVAAGQFAIPRVQGDRPEYFWNFSVEYNMMAVHQGMDRQKILRYLLLTVQGERIIVKQTIIHKNAKVFGYNSGLEFDKNGDLRRFSGEFVCNPGEYLDGWTVDGTNNKLLYFAPINQGVKTPPYTTFYYNFFNITTGQKWEILSNRQINNILCGNQDGKYILLRNCIVSNNLKLIHEYLSKNVKIDHPFEIINAEVALYNNSGDKEAVFSINMVNGGYGSFYYSKVRYQFGSNFCLSSDGKNVGATCFDKDGKQYFVILGR